MLSYFDEIYRLKVLPLIKEQAKQIDDDIRQCIKTEYEIFGSIVKRYGDWAKFIIKEILMLEMPNEGNIYFNKQLYYRGKHIMNYNIKIDFTGG